MSVCSSHAGYFLACLVFRTMPMLPRCTPVARKKADERPCPLFPSAQLLSGARAARAARLPRQAPRPQRQPVQAAPRPRRPGPGQRQQQQRGGRRRHVPLAQQRQRRVGARPWRAARGARVGHHCAVAAARRLAAGHACGPGQVGVAAAASLRTLTRREARLAGLVWEWFANPSSPCCAVLPRRRVHPEPCSSALYTPSALFTACHGSCVRRWARPQAAAAEQRQQRKTSSSQ